MLGENKTGATPEGDARWRRQEAMPGSTILGEKEAGARPGGNSMWQHRDLPRMELLEGHDILSSPAPPLPDSVFQGIHNLSVHGLPMDSGHGHLLGFAKPLLPEEIRRGSE